MAGLGKFFREVHRRDLWQVLVASVGIGWAVLQGADLFIERGLLPEWTFTGTLIALGLGLPLLVATAFVQQGSPLAVARRERDAVRSAPQTDETGQEKDPENDELVWVAVPPSDGSQLGWLARSLTWNRAILATVLVFASLGAATVIYTVMRISGVGAPATLVARGVMEKGDIVVLADFVSNAGTAVPGELVTEALRIDFDQSPTFDVADQSRVADALKRMRLEPDTPLHEELARELAVREGLKAVISGEVGRLGGRFVITARLTEAAGGSVLASFRETARDSTKLIDAIDQLSAKVRSKTGESLRSVASSEPLRQVTTSSLEALRKYTFASSRYARGTMPAGRAIQIHGEAVQLDTTFALAYRAQAILLSHIGGSYREAMADVSSRAYRHRDRLTPRERYLVEASYHRFVTGNEGALAQAYQSVLDLDSLDNAALLSLADAHMFRGRYEEAEALIRRRPPSGIVWYINLGGSQAGQGRFDAALSTFQAAVDALPEHPFPPLWEALFLATQGRGPEADSVLADVNLNGAERIFQNMVTARARTSSGRLQSASQAWDDVLDQLEEYSSHAEVLDNGLDQVWWEGWLRMSADRALVLMDSVLTRTPPDLLPPLDRSYPELALLSALLGDAEGALGYVNRYEVEVPSQSDPRGRQDVAVARALAAVTRTNGSDAAVRELETAVRELRCARCRQFYLGHAYELVGDRPRAIESYERFLADGFIDASTVITLHFRARVHERLGALYEAHGNNPMAVEHYQRFAEMWSGADPDLQPRVTRAKEQVERLRGEVPVA